MHRLAVTNKSPAFTSVVGLISTHISFGATMALYQQRDLGSLLRNDKCQYEGNASTTGITLEFRAHALMSALGQGTHPQSIEFDAFVGPHPPASMGDPWKIQKGADIGVWQGLSAFVSFYDSVEQEIKTIHGNDSSNWPDICNFARCWRNGLAHGNSIEIRNPSSPDFTWRRRTIGHGDNGTPILYSMAAFADLIVLMMDVADHIVAQQGGPADALTGATDL